MMVNMTCEQVRRMHPSLTDEARGHVSTCAECHAFVEAWEMLRAAPEIPAPADFYQGVRRKIAPPVLRWVGPLAGVAAVLLVAVVLLLRGPSAPPAGPSTAGITDEERELVEHLEVLQNYELLSTLEMLNESPALLEDKK